MSDPYKALLGELYTIKAFWAVDLWRSRNFHRIVRLTDAERIQLRADILQWEGVLVGNAGEVAA